MNLKTRVPHILVVGSLNMDLVVQMPSIPRPGETLLGGRFATFPGG
jgi:ribokinase